MCSIFHHITNLNQNTRLWNKSSRIIVFLPNGKPKTKENSLVLQRDSRSSTGSSREGGMQGVIISATKEVTVDLSIAKVYLSIFPIKEAKILIEGISSNAAIIRHELHNAQTPTSPNARIAIFYR